MTPGVQTPGLSPGNCGRGQSRTRRGGRESPETPRKPPQPRAEPAGLQPRMQTNLGMGRCASWGRCPGEARSPSGEGTQVCPWVGPNPNPASRLPRPNPHPRALLALAPPTRPLPRPFTQPPRPTSLGHAHFALDPALSLQPRPYPAPWHRPRHRPAPRPVASPARRRGRRCAPFESMAPGGRLVLCEEKIREKSGLAPHCDLGARRAAGGGGRWWRALVEGASFPLRWRRTGQARGRKRPLGSEPPQA